MVGWALYLTYWTDATGTAAVPGTCARQLLLDTPARFHTRSGLLTARRTGAWIELDFPTIAEEPADPPAGLTTTLGVTPRYVGRTRFDYLGELDSEEAVRAVWPDFAALRTLPVRGIIVTARVARLRLCLALLRAGLRHRRRLGDWVGALLPWAVLERAHGQERLRRLPGVAMRRCHARPCDWVARTWAVKRSQRCAESSWQTPPIASRGNAPRFNAVRESLRWPEPMQHLPDAASATGELISGQAPGGTGGGEQDRRLDQVPFDSREIHVRPGVPPRRHVVEQSADALQLLMHRLTSFQSRSIRSWIDAAHRQRLRTLVDGAVMPSMATGLPISARTGAR